MTSSRCHEYSFALAQSLRGGDVIMNAAASRADKTSARCRGLPRLAFGNSASAAQKSVSWNDEACVHRISFDPAKHDEKRLKHTINLLFEPSNFEAPVPPFVGEPKAIAGLDLGKFDQQCSAALKTVREFELASAQRHRRLSAGQDRRDRRRMPVRQCRNPRPAQSVGAARIRERRAAAHFIDALEGKTDIDEGVSRDGRAAMQRQRIAAKSAATALSRMRASRTARSACGSISRCSAGTTAPTNPLSATDSKPLSG